MAQLFSLGHVATILVKPQQTKNMTNEQIAEHLKKIGSHAVGAEQAMLSVAFSVGKLYEFIGNRMPSMEPEERAFWIDGARKALDSQNRAKAELEEFRRAVEVFSRL